MSDASGRKSAARSGAGKTLRGHDARYLEKTVGCRSCKPAGIDERMKYFEQRGSLKTGDILKDHKRRHNEYQNADGLLVKEICESEALFYGKKGKVFSEPFSVPSMLKYPWLRHRE